MDQSEVSSNASRLWVPLFGFLTSNLALIGAIVLLASV
jgi:hypothetical protein